MATNELPIFQVKTDKAKGFLIDFVKYASAWALEITNINDFEMELLYAITPSANDIKKKFIVDMSNLGKKHRILENLKYISSQLYTAPFSAEIYMTQKQKSDENKEFMKIIHESAKKWRTIYPYSRYNHLQNIVEENFIIKDIGRRREDDKTAALALVALGSGFHRHGLALRQVAAQEVFARLYEGAAEEFSVLLAALYADVYVWFPYESSLYRGVAEKELLHSVLVGEIFNIGENLLGGFKDSLDVACLYKGFYERLTEEFSRIFSGGRSKSVSQALEEVFVAVKRTLNSFSYKKELKIKSDILLGRFKIVLDKLSKIHGGKEGGIDCDVAVIPLTEQTGYTLIKYLSANNTSSVIPVKCKKIYVIYTPQTLYNRLWIEDVLSGSNDEKKKDNKNKVDYIYVPGLESRIAFEIINGIEINDGEEHLLFVAQGPLPVYTALLSLAYRCYSRNKKKPPHIYIVSP